MQRHPLAQKNSFSHYGTQPRPNNDLAQTLSTSKDIGTLKVEIQARDSVYGTTSTKDSIAKKSRQAMGASVPRKGRPSLGRQSHSVLDHHSLKLESNKLSIQHAEQDGKRSQQAQATTPYRQQQD